jgi:hypothetical protein
MNKLQQFWFDQMVARAFEPSIPDFDNRTYRRALEQALKTLGTAEEHFARMGALEQE